MNDGMGKYVANEVLKLMLKAGIQVLGSDVLILGFTFKENCPDIRNTKVIDIYTELKEYNLNIIVYDPWVDSEVAKQLYNIQVDNTLPKQTFDAVILAVAHDCFTQFDILNIKKDKSVVYDVKGCLDRKVINGGL